MTHNELVERVTMYLRGMGENGKPIVAPNAFGTFRIVGGVRDDGGRDVLYKKSRGIFACVVAVAIHDERFYGHVCSSACSYDDDLRSSNNGYVEMVGEKT